jgi:dual-specificity kinase
MVRKLGEGVFAKVIQVRNLEDQSMQALKIIRKTKAYRQAAVHEIKILLELAKANIDVGGREKLIVEMRDYFDYFGHVRKCFLGINRTRLI